LKTHRYCATAAVGGAAVACAAVSLWLPALWSWQRDVYTSQQKFEKQIPPTARIGCFNAGIPAYFSNRPIVNLDGLVNNQVAAYWKNGNFERFLIDYKIDYIMDEEQTLAKAQKFSSQKLRLQPLNSAPLTNWPTEKRYLWKVVQPQSRS
jgi:hypothetical protein